VVLLFVHEGSLSASVRFGCFAVGSHALGTCGSSATNSTTVCPRSGHLKSENPIQSLNFARIPYITLNRNTPNCHALDRSPTALQRKPCLPAKRLKTLNSSTLADLSVPISYRRNPDYFWVDEAEAEGVGRALIGSLIG
jgi:hypothetical protein